MKESFGEKSLNIVDLVKFQSHFDFVTCQRADGSFYGNGGSKCVLGAESSLPEKGDSVGFGERVSKALDKYSEGVKRLYPEISDTKEVVSMAEEHEKLSKEIEKVLRNGDLDFKDLEDFAVNSGESRSFTEANFVVIGMEPGSSERGDQYEVFARDLALYQLEKKYGVSNKISAANIVGEQVRREISGGPKEGWYLGALENTKEAMGEEAKRHSASFAKMMDSLVSPNPGDERVWRNAAASYMSSALAVKDTLPFRSVSVGQKGVYEVLENQKDSRIRSITGREQAKRLVGDRRMKRILQDFNEAVQVNPKLGGGIAFPGSNRNNSESWEAYRSMAKAHQESGGKSYQGKTSWTVARGKPNQREVEVDAIVMEFSSKTGQKKFFVVPAASVNSTLQRIQLSGPDSVRGILEKSSQSVLNGEFSDFVY